MVDVPEIEFIDRDGVARRVQRLGFLPVDTFIQNDLLSRIRRMTAHEFHEARARWARLKKENARLRVLAETGLVSAPITHFDELLLSCVTSEWQRCARVLGDAHDRANSGAFDQTNIDFLWFRLIELINDGVVECGEDGDVLDMRRTSVRRLPSSG